jgi:CBS domain containing-hemolysin-like protein
MFTIANLHTLEIELTEALLRLVVLLGLTLTIAFFVAAELALVSASKEQIYRLSQDESNPKHKVAGLVHQAQNQIERYLSITQTGTTAGSLLLGWIGEGATVHWIEPWFHRLPIGRLPAVITTHTIAVAIAFLLVTYVEIVLGELVPKVLAANAPEQTALLLIRPLQFCSFLFAPVLVILNGTVWLLTSRFTQRDRVFELSASQSPILQMDPHSVTISGVVEVDKINQELGLNLPESLQYRTIAGFVIHHLGRVPAQDECLVWGELELEAQRVAEGSLQMVLLRQVTQPLAKQLNLEAALASD